MAVVLNKIAFDYAKKLIANRRCVLDERGDWSDHKPSRQIENRFIEEHGFAEYAKWHLGEDDEIEEHSTSRYKFPYGDFQAIHRCAVLAAEARAGQYKHFDIEQAAAVLLHMLNQLLEEKTTATKERRHAPSA
jgi:hypothetical protein